MCSRFELNSPRQEVSRLFPDVLLPDDIPGGEIRPTNAVMVITGETSAILRWGIAAPWDGKPLINARSETLADKPTFRPYLDNRCLIPASAYFEWRSAPGGKRKNRISPANGGLFIFAGLYGDGKFTILTCAPVPSIAHIHNRMPVILGPERAGAWMDGGDADLLIPQDGQLSAAEDIPAQGDLF